MRRIIRIGCLLELLNANEQRADDRRRLIVETGGKCQEIALAA